MTEIYKSLNNMNPSIVWEFHEKKYVAYDLRKKNLCKLPKAKTISYGVESLSFRGSFLWNTLDDNVKQDPTLARFKNKIRNWAGEPCTCIICRNITGYGTSFIRIMVFCLFYNYVGWSKLVFINTILRITNVK